MALRPEGVVLAAEGHDLHVHPLLDHRSDLVGIQPGAVDDMAGLHRTPGRFQGQGTPMPGDALHGGTREDVSAGMGELAGICLGHLGVVGDAGGRGPQGLDAGGVRLDLPQPLRADDLQPLHAIGHALSYRFCSRPSSDSSVATMTFPHCSYSISFSSQNWIIFCTPATQKLAL